MHARCQCFRAVVLNVQHLGVRGINQTQSVDMEGAMITSAVVLLLMLMETMAAGVPPWLAGQPDSKPQPARCHWYQWLFAEADRLVGQPVSEDPLARRRLLNLANRLAEHHRAQPQAKYRVTLRYLWLGQNGPAHFSLHINAETLEAILGQGACRRR